jgi:hypothetical protein
LRDRLLNGAKANVLSEEARDGVDIGLEAAQAFDFVRNQFEEKFVFFRDKLGPSVRQCVQHLPATRHILVVFSRCDNRSSRRDLCVA